MSPAVYCLVRCASRAVSAMDSLMAAMPGGQGFPARSGTGASPRGMCRSASLMTSSGVMRSSDVAWLLGAGTGWGSGSWMLPVSAPRMAAARSWARAVRAVCRQMPLKLRVWDWSQPRTSLPVLMR